MEMDEPRTRSERHYGDNKSVNGIGGGLGATALVVSLLTMVHVPPELAGAIAGGVVVIVQGVASWMTKPR